jgi:hypothetical protein
MTVCISGAIFGILGAGGSTGSSIFIFGIKEGNSGNIGGCDKSGILGIDVGMTHILMSSFHSIPDIFPSSLRESLELMAIFGGCGKFGSSRRGIVVGIN